jgi:hypothetical protein
MLADAKLPKYPSSGVPIHSIVSLRHGEARGDAVKRLAANLHGLADEWRELYAVHGSIEQEPKEQNEPNDQDKSGPSSSPSQTPSDSNTSTLATSAIELPILTGVLIISSLVAIVALDPNEEFPGRPARGQNQVRQFIVCDFSHQPYDVWNALAIVVVAMHLRKVRLGYEVRAPESALEEGLLR